MTNTIDDFYLLVSEAIYRAETLQDMGSPEARVAFSEVSELEERIAHLLPSDSAEGEIARRGAVRAAVASGDSWRAARLVSDYITEPGTSPDLKSELSSLLVDNPLELTFFGDEPLLLDDVQLRLVAPPLENPRIFISSALTGASNENQGTAIEHLLSAISNSRQVVSVSVAESVLDTGPRPIWSPISALHLLEADAFVVVAGRTTLVGREIAWAGARNIPILYLHHDSTYTSRLLRELPFDMEIVSFKEPTDVYSKVTDWMTRKSSAIELGPAQRRMFEMRLAPLHNQLRRNFQERLVDDLITEPALEQLSETVGIPSEQILVALQRPLALAALPASGLSKLVSALGIDLGRGLVDWEIAPLGSTNLIALRQAQAEMGWSDTVVRALAEVSGAMGLPAAAVIRFDLSSTKGWTSLFEAWRTGRLR